MLKQHQTDTIENLIEKSALNVQHVQNQAHNELSSSLAGTIKTHSSKEALVQEIEQCKPLTGICDSCDNIWMAFRPNDGSSNSRSKISMLKLVFDDKNGKTISGICWFSPVNLPTGRNCIPETIQFDSMQMLLDDKTLSSKAGVKSCVVIPLMHQGRNTQTFSNSCCALASDWKERLSDGTFSHPTLNHRLHIEWMSDNV